MTGVEDRVKGFLEAWQRKKQAYDLQCTDCGDKLEDGNFAVIDGDMLCLNCMRVGINEQKGRSGEERHG